MQSGWEVIYRLNHLQSVLNELGCKQFKALDVSGLANLFPFEFQSHLQLTLKKILKCLVLVSNSATALSDVLVQSPE